MIELGDNILSTLIPDSRPPSIYGRWGVVTSVNPLRLRLEGDTETLDVTPKTLVQVKLGDEVYCQIMDGQLLILGVAGGAELPPMHPPRPAYDDGHIYIDGQWWLPSGSVVVPSFSWGSASFTGVHVTTINMPIPFVPPSGWTFSWSVQESQGFTFCDGGNRFISGGTMAVRILQIASSSTTALKRLQWQLVRL